MSPEQLEASIAKISMAHERLFSTETEDAELLNLIRDFHPGMNCETASNGMLWAVLPICAVRSHLEEELLYQPVAAMIAWGFIEESDIFNYIKNFAETEDSSYRNWNPETRETVRNWFSRSSQHLRGVIYGIVNKHWP